MNVLINSAVGILSQIYIYQNIQLYTLHYNFICLLYPNKTGEKKAPAQGPSQGRHSGEVWLLELEVLS